MAGLGRESTFLPTIKCSMCHRDIQISQMGDHICGSSGDRRCPTIYWQKCADLTGLATPPPDAYGNYGSMRSKQSPTGATGFLNPGRSIPPRVDTSVASAFPSVLELRPIVTFE
jgi:hypothetical protein